MTEDTHYKVLKILEQNPQITQRELASELGISLGKANYCLKALVSKGLVKARNFKNKKNKLAYSYLLTPKGIEQKTSLTLSFLDRKREEYEALEREIDILTREVAEAHR